MVVAAENGLPANRAQSVPAAGPRGRQTGKIEQRNEMVRRRDGSSIIRMLANLQYVARRIGQLRDHGVVEALRPVCRTATVAAAAKHVIDYR